MQAFPFDSELTYDEHDNPIYDRAVSSQPLRKLIKELFTTGVMPNPSTNFQVSAGSDGMTVQVAGGSAVIDGGLCHETEVRTLEVTAADNTYDRIDTVVLRWNENVDVRTADLYVVAGTPAVNPVRPTLQRNNSIYEIGIADVFITKRVATITTDKITDTRYEAERCGIVSSISEFDTTTLYQQIQADLAGFKSTEQANFMSWFGNIQGILDTDAAGHLQIEIDELSDSVSQQIETINANLTANNNKFIAGYVDGEYGFYIDGEFRPFSDGTTYLGEFSANTNIDISELSGNPTAEDFIFVINESASVHKSEANYQNYASGYSKFYPASFTVNGNTLALTVPYERVYNFGDDREPGDHADVILKGKLYYKPSAVIGTYTSGQTIDVSAYRPLTVAQFVVAEIAEANTPNNGYTTYQNWGTVYAYYTKSTLTLSGNTLTVTAPKTSASVGGESTIQYKLCYLGKALKFSKQGF